MHAPEDEARSDEARQNTAAYLADFSRQLADIARASDLKMLAYLLDMAGVEASSLSGEDRVRRRSPISHQ